MATIEIERIIESEKLKKRAYNNIVKDLTNILSTEQIKHFELVYNSETKDCIFIKNNIG